jgi:hypothetical protein
MDAKGYPDTDIYFPGGCCLFLPGSTEAKNQLDHHGTVE